MRSSMRPSSQNCSEAAKRLSGISQGSAGKKVMFSGVASDEEEVENEENIVQVCEASLSESQARALQGQI